LAGLPAVKKSISFRAAWRIGRILELAHGAVRSKREPRMTRFLAAQLAKHHYFDISRAGLDFGYTPKIPTDEGM
jgi:nucleoside-diphosphate-sugar epimerase